MKQSKVELVLLHIVSIIVTMVLICTSVNATGEVDKAVKKPLTATIKLSDEEQQQVESLGQRSSNDLLELKSIIDKRLGADPDKSLIAIGSPKLMKVHNVKVDTGATTKCFLDYNYGDIHCISVDCGHRWTCW